ncbi:hypothetical protein [Variovorax sp. RCC_210]|uniref:hypothetical protein n=1 Tax=Variovorax sp. RCC_210 TaxID=3239217 RepID=UPI0035251960
MKLPSLVNGRQCMPNAPMATATEYVAVAPVRCFTARAPVVISDAEHAITQPEPIKPVAKRQVAKPAPPVQRFPDYRPREGSAPSRALEALRGMPPHSYLTPDWAQRNLGVDQSCFHPIFKTAVEKKALMRAVIGRRAALALPGFDPDRAVLASEPETAVSPPLDASARLVDALPVKDAGGEASPELQEALHELSLREAEARAWQAYVELLQLRARISRVALALPFPPLTEPTRPTGAA